MIIQTEMLDGLIHHIVKAKESLYDEFRANYEGLPVDELNAQYRKNYQAAQDSLMKCMQLLIRTKYELKNLYCNE